MAVINVTINDTSNTLTAKQILRQIDSALEHTDNGLKVVEAWLPERGNIIRKIEPSYEDADLD